MRNPSVPLATRGLLLATLVLFLSGCSASVGRWTRADYELNPDPAAAESGSVPISPRIYLISDNQRHELLGDGVRLFRTSVADKHTPVAIRPPQLDLFGQDLLREAVAMTDGFILHLGDACDISNTGEFGLFAWDMRHAPHGWVMAPGNHDGYFFGNSSRVLPPLVREWNESAETYEYDGATIDSRSLQKDRFVSYYMASLVLQDAVWSAPLAASLGPEFEKHLERWRARVANSSAGEPSFTEYWSELEALQERIYDLEMPGDHGYLTFELPAGVGTSGQPHLRRIAWRIAKKLAWRSFVLQEVDISATAEPAGPQDKTSVLVVDSSQYNLQPSMEAAGFSKIPAKVTKGYFDEQAAGLTGAVQESQEKAATEFADAMKREGRQWMLASHHPYRTLARNSAPRFDRLRDAGGIPVTFSSHSHKGEILWNRDDEREGDWLEINVGSILDSPVEFGEFQLLRTGDRLAIEIRRHPMEERLREAGLLADKTAAYRPVSGDADFFMNYEDDGFTGTSISDFGAPMADFRVKHLLLAAYQRMFELHETDGPDQSGTYWPAGPEGSRLGTHEEVNAAVQAMLEDATLEEAGTLTQFLYELREYDRTRSFSPALKEELRVYRLSQAIWAGHAEYRTWKEEESHGIAPEPSLLILPPTSVTNQGESP